MVMGNETPEEQVLMILIVLYVGGSSVFFLLLPLIGALIFLEEPFTWIIVSLYSLVFCYLLYKTIQILFDRGEESGTDLKFKVED